MTAFATHLATRPRRHRAWSPPAACGARQTAGHPPSAFAITAPDFALFDAVLDDEVVLPEQWASPAAETLTPERVLLLGILRDQLILYHRHRSGASAAYDPRGQRIAKDAVVWFLSDSDDPGSFRWIAEHLGQEVDPAEPVARRLERLDVAADVTLRCPPPASAPWC